MNKVMYLENARTPGFFTTAGPDGGYFSKREKMPAATV
jgi:hypothetical protein